VILSGVAPSEFKTPLWPLISPKRGNDPSESKVPGRLQMPQKHRNVRMTPSDLSTKVVASDGLEAPGVTPRH
jgi:hypothetical protein